MKKILPAILFFVIIQVTLVIVHSQIMNKSHLHLTGQKLQRLEHEPYYLVMGNSHVLALQEAQLPGSFNIGTYAEKLHHSYYKLSYLVRKKEIVPRYVILSFDLGLLQHQHVDIQGYQYYWNRYENLTELARFSTDIFSYWGHRFLGYIFPYYNSEVDAFDFFFSQRDQPGERLRDEQASMPSNSTLRTRILDPSCLEAQFSEQGMFYVTQFLTLCTTYDIPVALVRFPVTSAYYFGQSECFDPESYYSKLKTEILLTYSNVSVLDYHDIYADSLFRDPHHLKGGKVREEFTKLVYANLLQLQSANSTP